MNRYSRDMVKMSVAKMLQTIGWHSIHTTPLEMLTDILIQYLTQMGKLTNDYANEFGCIDPSMDHLGLVFREFHINLSDLEEYVTNVDFGHAPFGVPKYPIPKENHLNFLKPGSKEVVTRPVHIHEHLPPMFAVQEANEAEAEALVKQEEVDDATTENSSGVFKRPIDISPGETFKRPRLLMEEEGRPTREISSVIMTTSGYISPAREGKLPESRTPLTSIEVAPPPHNNNNSNNTANNTNNNTNTITVPVVNPKPNKLVKKIDRKREKIGKELFKPLDEKIKKMPTMKDIAKLKMIKNIHSLNNAHQQFLHHVVMNSDLKIPMVNKQPSINRDNKTLAAARLKTEKLNTTITPIPMKPTGLPNDAIDKLFTEPDKKKVNILKKISYIKNDKVESKVKLKDEIKQESREGSPVLIIDEPVEPPKVHISNDITIELVDSSTVNKAPEKIEKPYGYDDSPPGTPLTPKTPEISHSPPLTLTKARNKRKDKTKVKKVQKVIPQCVVDNDIEVDVDVRPKTPEAQIDKHVMFALGLTQYAPGLIPHPFFPNMNMPLRFPGFGKPPFMPLMPPYPMDFQQPMMRPKEPPVVPPRPPIERPQPPVLAPSPLPPIVIIDEPPPPKPEKKTKEHKKEKKDKIKKKNKKDKVKDKAEKKKLKEEKKDKEKVKKEKREKKKEKELQYREIDSIPKLTLKLGTPASNTDSPDTRKLNIKPIIKKEEESDTPNVEINREMSPELAKISALVTGQPKPKSTNNISNDNFGTSSDSFHNQMKKAMFKPIPKKEVAQESVNVGLSNPTPSSYIDSEGNEVWICPGCDKQDDGSPMIGCDDCDAWYHWVCVGIQVPPDDNENWYCRHCLAKKQEVLQTDKKKKRKKREKKEH